MIRLIAEAYLALSATLKALTFRPNWQAGLDVSMTGFWHSFFAVIPSILLVGFSIISFNHAGFPIEVFRVWLVFALSWLIFPGAAAVTTIILGVRQSFVPWVVLHNWGVVWLYALTTFYWTLLTAGLITLEVLQVLFFMHLYFRMLVHWRIAYVTLGLPTITSALAAAVPIVVLEITRLVVYQAFPASGG